MVSLLPQDTLFQKMLTELTALAANSAHMLDVLVKNASPESTAQAAKQIAENKTRAKKLSQDVHAAVCRTFITPFDREDLQELNTVLYFIPKLIHKTQLRIETYQIYNWEDDLAQFTTVIVRQTDALKELIALVNGKRNLNDMYSLTAVLHELEDQGDTLLVQLTAKSFYAMDDVKHLFLRHDVYRLLEQVTNTYRDCANLAMNIVLKHS